MEDDYIHDAALYPYDAGEDGYKEEEKQAEAEIKALKRDLSETARALAAAKAALDLAAKSSRLADISVARRIYESASEANALACERMSDWLHERGMGI